MSRRGLHSGDRQESRVGMSMRQQHGMSMGRGGMGWRDLAWHGMARHGMVGQAMNTQ